MIPYSQLMGTPDNIDTSSDSRCDVAGDAEMEENHSVGDTLRVRADSDSIHEEAHETHDIELYDPTGRVGLVWTCDRCGKYAMDPKVFKSETCVPWERNTAT